MAKKDKTPKAKSGSTNPSATERLRKMSPKSLKNRGFSSRQIQKIQNGTYRW